MKSLSSHLPSLLVTESYKTGAGQDQETIYTDGGDLVGGVMQVKGEEK